MKAINGYVFVLPDEVGERRSESGLILPESKATELQAGTVKHADETYISSGEEYGTQFMEGDRVLYAPSAGVRWGRLVVLRVVDVLAILE